jgi:triacylglycerol esterase/lipase EstA (alpha/beta hydrolase family)
MTKPSLLSNPTRTDSSRLPWDTHGKYGGWGGDTTTEPTATVSRTPIVFVHGNQRDASDWETHRRLFKDGDYTNDELWGITFKQGTPTHDEMASQLDDFVGKVLDYTDAASVVIVAHSLGVTGVRHWLHESGRDEWVAGFIALAGANHGIGYAEVWCRLGLDRGASRMSQYLRSDYDELDSHPLQELNENETPHSFPYYTIRGSHDRLYALNPESPVLDGAVENVVLQTNHDGVRESADALVLIETWVRDCSK